MKLVKLGGQPLQLGNKETKRRVSDAKQAQDLKAKLEKAAYKVTGLETKEKKRNPAAPFTTAKLQQESAQKLKMSVSRTMQNAQRLYEGADFGEGPVGLITYMRTDSPRLAPEAVEATRAFIAKKYGKEYLPAKARIYLGKAGAQDAHEAIRPTDITRTPKACGAISSRTSSGSTPSSGGAPWPARWRPRASTKRWCRPRPLASGEEADI